MKKASVLMCSLVVLSLLLSCTKQQPAANQSAADPYEGLPMEFSTTILDRGLVPASEGSMENNRWTRWINENSPVKVTWVPVTRTESMQKINALLASGSAPDVIWEYGKGPLDNLYAQGVIQPVDEHLEKYSTEYREYLEQHPEWMPYMVGSDGRQYGMSSARGFTSIPNTGLWIRQDWLDKFGMSTPTNTDELLVFLRRVRDEDPDGNGIKDTIALAKGNGAIWNAIFGQPYEGNGLVDGHYQDWTETQGYREALAFQALLYKEGLTDPEFVTDTVFQRARQILVTGKAGVYLGSCHLENEWRQLKQNVPTSDLVPLEPFATVIGKFGLQTEYPWEKMVLLNKDAKNPKAVMAYFDWLISGNWMTLAFGEEGRHYQLVNGIPKAIDAEINTVETSYLVGGGNFEWAHVHQYQPTTDWLVAQVAEDPISQQWARTRGLAYEVALRTPYLRIFPYGPTSDAIRQFGADTSLQVTGLENDIIMGRLSVDEGIRQIFEIKNAAGWKAINDEKDAWYQANKHLF